MYLEKTLRYGLERETEDLHSKFGPILINTDRVLSSYADNELKRWLLYHCSVQTYGTNDREYH